jgi:hypothetical protein
LSAAVGVSRLTRARELVRVPEGGFKTQALLCTDLEADPQKILSWFVMRRRLEVDALCCAARMH